MDPDPAVSYEELEVHFSDWDNVLQFITRYQFSDALLLNRQLPFSKGIVDAYITPMAAILEASERVFAKGVSTNLDGVLQFVKAVVEFNV